MSPMLAATETNRIAGEAGSGETYSECVGNATLRMEVAGTTFASVSVCPIALL